MLFTQMKTPRVFSVFNLLFNLLKLFFLFFKFADLYTYGSFLDIITKNDQ